MIIISRKHNKYSNAFRFETLYQKNKFNESNYLLLLTYIIHFPD